MERIATALERLAAAAERWNAAALAQNEDGSDFVQTVGVYADVDGEVRVSGAVGSGDQ